MTTTIGCVNVMHNEIDCAHSDLPRSEWCEVCIAHDLYLYAEAQRDCEHRELQVFIRSKHFPLQVWVWLTVANVVFFGTLYFLFTR